MITAKYEEPNITVKVSVTEGKVEQTQLIYNGKVVKETKNGQDITYKVEAKKTGLYTVRAKTDKGIIKYAYVRAVVVSDTIQRPIITVIPDKPTGEENWYITTPKIRITSTISGTIKYTLRGEKAQAETKYTNEIEINKSGITTLTAWVEKDGKESRKVNQTIKVDIDKPEIANIEISGEDGNIVEGATKYKWKINTAEITVKPKVDTETKKEDKRKWNSWI